MDKSKSLWVYKLVFGSEMIGYRFQEPDAMGIAGDVLVSDVSLIKKLRGMFNTKIYGSIPLKETSEGGYVTPFEDSSVFLTEDNIEGFIDSVSKSEFWYDRDIRELEEYDWIMNSDVKKFIDICKKNLEGIGSMVLTVDYDEDISRLKCEIRIQDFLNMLQFIKGYCEDVDIMEITPDLTVGCRELKEPISINNSFVKTVCTKLGYNSRGSVPRSVGDIGDLLGHFGCLGSIDSEEVFDIVVYVGVGSGYGKYSKDYTAENNKIKDWKWLTVD